MHTIATCIVDHMHVYFIEVLSFINLCMYVCKYMSICMYVLISFYVLLILIQYVYTDSMYVCTCMNKL